MKELWEDFLFEMQIIGFQLVSLFLCILVPYLTIGAVYIVFKFALFALAN